VTTVITAAKETRFFVIHILSKLDKILRERTVTSSITIRCLATIKTAAMPIFSFQSSFAALYIEFRLYLGRDPQFAGPFGL